MLTVEAIHVAPVKSLALLGQQHVRVTERGIAEDRRFFVIDAAGRLVTQRQIGALVQVWASYNQELDLLTLRFPDCAELAGEPGLGEPVQTVIWGRVVAGRVIEGRWNEALSEFCGQQLRLVRSDESGRCYDEYPISVISQATVEFLSSLTGGRKRFDGRRFRPNFLLSGAEPHQEDGWLDRGLRLGEDVVLRIVARDPRCAITTLDPDTGRRDFDTLRLILGYRPSARAAYLGVYGVVDKPGIVSVGDAVVPAA